MVHYLHFLAINVRISFGLDRSYPGEFSASVERRNTFIDTVTAYRS